MATSRSATARVLGWGSGVGAAFGGVAGLIIGVFAYLPTAPFALIEGAVFGGVIGLGLSLFAAAGWLLSRTLVRR